MPEGQNKFMAPVRDIFSPGAYFMEAKNLDGITMK